MSFVYDNEALDTALFVVKSNLKAVTNATTQISADDLNNLRTTTGEMRDILRDSVVSVRSFGAECDGTTDDGAALLNAIEAAEATVHTGFGGFVLIPKGTLVTSEKAVLPHGVWLIGSGGLGCPPSSILKAHPSFSDTALVENLEMAGGQEFAGLAGLIIDGNKGNGAVCSTAVVNLVSLFVNSYVRDCIIQEGSNIGLRIAADGTPGGMGPIHILNCWVTRNTGHNVYVEDAAGNTGAATGIVFDTLTSENQGSNKSAIYLKGNGRLAGITFKGATHIEMGSAATGRTGITIDGAPFTSFDNVQLLSDPSTVTTGISITNVVSNVGIEIKRVYNPNLITTVLSDAKNSVTIGTTNFTSYTTADWTYRGAPRFLPHTTTGSQSLVAQSSAGVDRAWFDDLGQLTGNSLNGAGVDIVGDATNDRPLALINHAKSRVFAWYYPDASNLRFKYFTGGLDCLNFASDASMFVYGTSTFQLLSTFQSGIVNQASLRLTNEIAPAQITANQDNYAPTGFSTAAVLILTSDASRDITGFASPTTGRMIWVFNNGAQNIVLKNETTSTAANRIVGRGAADTTLTPKTGAQLYYSTSLTRWIVVGDTL